MTDAERSESLYNGARVVTNALDLLGERELAVGLLGEYVLRLDEGESIEPTVRTWFHERLMKTLGLINEQLVAEGLAPVVYPKA
jgi:hypothetical protein